MRLAEKAQSNRAALSTSLGGTELDPQWVQPLQVPLGTAINGEYLEGQGGPRSNLCSTSQAPRVQGFAVEPVLQVPPGLSQRSSYGSGSRHSSAVHSSQIKRGGNWRGYSEQVPQRPSHNRQGTEEGFFSVGTAPQNLEQVANNFGHPTYSTVSSTNYFDGARGAKSPFTFSMENSFKVGGFGAFDSGVREPVRGSGELRPNQVLSGFGNAPQYPPHRPPGSSGISVGSSPVRPEYLQERRQPAQWQDGGYVDNSGAVQVSQTFFPVQPDRSRDAEDLRSPVVHSAFVQEGGVAPLGVELPEVGVSSSNHAGPNLQPREAPRPSNERGSGPDSGLLHGGKGGTFGSRTLDGDTDTHRAFVDETQRVVNGMDDIKKAVTSAINRLHLSKEYVAPNPDHPVHCGNTTTIEMARFLDKVKRLSKVQQGTILPRIEMLLDLFQNVETLRELTTTIDLFAGTKSNISQKVCDAMRDAETITEIDPADILRTAIAFLVGEPDKCRNRFILWPRQLNEEYRRRYKFDIWMPSLWEVQQLARSMDSGVAFDLTRSFFQIEIPKECQPYFAFINEDGKAYAFTRMPMGAVPAAELMHGITTVIAKLAQDDVNNDPEVPTSIFDPGDPNYAYDSHKVRIAPYIDNILAGGSLEAATAFAAAMQRVCAEFTIMLNEEPHNSPSNCITFCGQKFTFDRKTVSSSQKTVESLQKYLDWLERLDGRSWVSMRQYAGLMGTLIWASRVLRVPMQNFYTSMKCYRRRCSQITSYDDGVTIWNCSLVQLKAWLQQLLSMVDGIPIPQQVTPLFTLYTDASLTGYGAVLFSPQGSIHTFQGNWRNNHNTHINLLEMEAATLALQHFISITRGAPVELVVDNTTVRGALVRGYSSSYEVNSALFQQNFNVVAVRYIRSADMPADPLTRGGAVQLHQVYNDQSYQNFRPSVVGWIYGQRE